MPEKPFAESAARNSGSILEVLRDELRHSESVLEIGSGTGQHAVCFAAALPHLCWQTSDREGSHSAINAWIDDSNLENIRRPLALDVMDATIRASQYDAVFSANTAHIMSFAAVTKMFALVGRALKRSGLFCVYGPFRVNGKFTTPSNQHFDASLRARDPSMGIRDLTALDELGAANGIQRGGLYALPANNLLAVWQKCAADCA